MPYVSDTITPKAGALHKFKKAVGSIKLAKDNGRDPDDDDVETVNAPGMSSEEADLECLTREAAAKMVINRLAAEEKESKEKNQR